MALLSLVAGVLPGAIAYVGKLIIDAVIAARRPAASRRNRALCSWPREMGLVVLLGARAARPSGVRSLLRAVLGHRVNVMILEKALTLELDALRGLRALRQDDARASRGLVAPAEPGVAARSGSAQRRDHARRRSARCSSRSRRWRRADPGRSPRCPPFVAETQVLRRRVPAVRAGARPRPASRSTSRRVIAREDHAKEVKLFGLGPRFLGRYHGIFDEALRARTASSRCAAALWGYRARADQHASRSTAPTLGSRCRPIDGAITLGDDDDVRLVFKQGAVGAVLACSATSAACTRTTCTCRTSTSSSNSPRSRPSGDRAPWAPRPATACASRTCRFTYPGASEPALEDIDLHIPPGSKLAIVGENGSGKTTLIKLLTRLYEPTDGPHHARRPATYASGIPTRCARASASSSRTSCATSSRSARTSAPATMRGYRRSRALGRRRATRAWRRPFIDDAAGGLRHAARPLVQERPRAVARPVAEGRARRARSCARTPTSSCSTSRPRRWTPRPR